jgi:hypothetical protein
VKESYRNGGMVRACVKKPSAEADKWHNEQQLERHDHVVRRLYGGLVEPERQRDECADGRWDANNGEASDRESEGEGERETPGRDALAEPLGEPAMELRYEFGKHFHAIYIDVAETGKDSPRMKVW